MLDNRLNSAFMKFKAESIIAVLLAMCISCISCASLVMLQNVYAGSPINVIAQQPFAGSDGKVNVVGVVKNNGSMPVEVVLGLNVVARSAGGGVPTTIKEPTYGRIIYPSSVSPFKFAVEPAWSVSGAPFILNAKEVLTPYYKPLSLSYSNIPAGSERALVGTAKNISPFDLHNVTILASVHNAKGTQIDSVKSKLFPVIRPGQIVGFTAVPDPSIKAHIAYFSCADISVGNNPALNTLRIGNGQFIAYQMYGVVQISDLKYDNATDSLVFGIKHYSPAGGTFGLKMPETSKNPVSVIMDGKLYSEASVKMDGKTVFVNFFVPPANHQVQIKGIRNITPTMRSSSCPTMSSMSTDGMNKMTPIIQNATTADYRIELGIGPTANMLMMCQVTSSTTSGEVMVASQMSPMSMTGNTYHLELHVYNIKTGAAEVVPINSVGITVTNSSGTKTTIPVAEMFDIGQGPTDFHNGNNVQLTAGNYMVDTNIGSENASFNVTISAMSSGMSTGMSMK